MATPHISAAEGAFAKTVLMPGDPLRAKFIAETFLTAPQLVTSVRNVLGYTGTYKGVRYLKASTIYYFTKAHFAASNDNRRGIGFDKLPLNKKGPSTASKSGSMKGYGHTGFTGTFVWNDPENDLLVVFLSNRVCPNADANQLMRLNIRSNIHDILYEAYPIKK